MAVQKQSFATVAKALGIHTNTLKNWQKAGKLPSAEKAIIKGVTTWMCDIDEAREVLNYGRTTIHNNSASQETNYSYTTDAQSIVQSQAGQLLDLINQAQAPLIEKLEQISRENGELRERIRNLEQSLEAHQPSQNQPVSAEQPEKASDIPSGLKTPYNASGDISTKKRRWPWSR